jgi:hypothetical protein
MARGIGCLVPPHGSHGSDHSGPNGAHDLAARTGSEHSGNAIKAIRIHDSSFVADEC